MNKEEIARLTMEEALTASHRNVFGVVFWFVLLPGPSGALLYRLAMFLRRRWGAPDPGEPPPASDSVMWKRVKRNLLFWRAATDVVQVSVFGPPTLVTGQPAKVSVYLHPPDTSESVHTLCRAFHHDAVLIGTGYVNREIVREENVAVHFSVANAGVSKSTLNLVWRGQPHRLVFELHVPWEAPGGPAPGVVSVGIDNVRIGKIEFRLHLAPRK
jgi:hypothetical protein